MQENIRTLGKVSPSILILRDNADLGLIVEKLERSGIDYHKLSIYGRTVIFSSSNSLLSVRDEGIASAASINNDYFLASRDFKNDDTMISAGNARIGSGGVTVAAGPCSIDFDGLEDFGKDLKDLGASIIRGGAFKPRTSPHTFPGRGIDGLDQLIAARESLGMPVVSEIMDASDLNLFRDIDILQVGSRNAQNFTLLRKLGGQIKPVLLKRGMGNTVNELLASAEYLIKGGNGSVIICERGIRTFESATRFTLDIGAVPYLKQVSHLPVCVDPSHAAGKRDMVSPLALAAVAAGADMLLIEVHPDPDNALSDSAQQLDLKQFKELMMQIGQLRNVLRKSI